MFAVNTYEEIEKNERLLNEKHIITLLFVRPSLPGAKDVINEFNYIHYNAGKYCSIYAVGYTNDEKYFKHHTTVVGIDGVPWYYNDAAFIAFKNKLEQRLKWKYSGEIELIILQSNPEGRKILDFRNYLAIDVNYGIKNHYIDSFNRFMESLIRSARSEIETIELTRKMNRSQYSVKDILIQSIGECKKIPAPIQEIIKDSLFYRTSTSYS